MANDIVLSDSFKASFGVVKSSIGLDSYPVEIAYGMVKGLIYAPAGMAVTEKDVMELMLNAQTMGLNPLKKGVYGFKDKTGHMISGVSLQGWRAAADARGGKIKRYRYGQLLSQKQDGVSFTFYEWIACDFKIDGEWTEGQRVFFEEVDKARYIDNPKSRLRSPWRVQPKRMHQNRAYTCAVAELFGFGAYSIEEARYAADLNVPVSDPEEEKSEQEISAEVIEAEPVSKGNERLANEIKKQEGNEFKPISKELEGMGLEPVDWKKEITSAQSLEELINCFKGLPPELQKDPDVLKLCTEMKIKFKESK